MDGHRWPVRGPRHCRVVVPVNAFSILSAEGDRAQAAANNFSRSLVASGWTMGAFQGTATKDYLKSLTDQGDAAFAKYATLGKPQSGETCKMQRLSITNGVGSALFNCPMTFTAGKGTLQVTLFGGGNIGWQVNGVAVQL